jgi:hypothetical protein
MPWNKRSEKKDGVQQLLADHFVKVFVVVQYVWNGRRLLADPSRESVRG